MARDAFVMQCEEAVCIPTLFDRPVFHRLVPVRVRAGDVLVLQQVVNGLLLQRLERCPVLFLHRICIAGAADAPALAAEHLSHGQARRRRPGVARDPRLHEFLATLPVGRVTVAHAEGIADANVVRRELPDTAAEVAIRIPVTTGELLQSGEILLLQQLLCLPGDFGAFACFIFTGCTGVGDGRARQQQHHKQCSHESIHGRNSVSGTGAWQGSGPRSPSRHSRGRRASRQRGCQAGVGAATPCCAVVHRLSSAGEPAWPHTAMDAACCPGAECTGAGARRVFLQRSGQPGPLRGTALGRDSFGGVLR